MSPYKFQEFIMIDIYLLGLFKVLYNIVEINNAINLIYKNIFIFYEIFCW